MATATMATRRIQATGPHTEMATAVVIPLTVHRMVAMVDTVDLAMDQVTDPDPDTAATGRGAMAHTDAMVDITAVMVMA